MLPRCWGQHFCILGCSGGCSTLGKTQTRGLRPTSESPRWPTSLQRCIRAAALGMHGECHRPLMASNRYSAARKCCRNPIVGATGQQGMFPGDRLNFCHPAAFSAFRSHLCPENSQEAWDLQNKYMCECATRI